MALSQTLKNNFRFHLQNLQFGHAYVPYWAAGMKPAQLALAYARRDLWLGQNKYPRPPEPIEHLRECGFSDDIVKSIGHTGWFTDIDQYDTLRGVVLQVSGKNRRARYVIAYHEKASGMTWLDRKASVIIGEQIGSSWDEDSGKREAARAADSFAESTAQKEVAYNTAWQAGSQWAELGEAIRDARKAVMALLTEWKAARKDAVNAGRTALCGAIRDKVTALCDQISEAREKRSQLATGDAPELYFFPRDKEMVAAFNEGAGESVL